jgi:hypothetical protein
MLLVLVVVFLATSVKDIASLKLKHSSSSHFQKFSHQLKFVFAGIVAASTVNNPFTVVQPEIAHADSTGKVTASLVAYLLCYPLQFR